MVYQNRSAQGFHSIMSGIPEQISTRFSQYHVWYTRTDQHKVFTVSCMVYRNRSAQGFHSIMSGIPEQISTRFSQYHVWYTRTDQHKVFTVSCLVYRNRSAQGFHSMVDWQTLSLSVYHYRSVQGFHSMAYSATKFLQYSTYWCGCTISCSISNGGNGQKSKKGKLLFDSNEIIMAQ